MKTAVAKKNGARRRPVEVSKNGHAPNQLVSKVRAGVPFRELEKLRGELALPLNQLAEKLGISRATLHRRKVAGRLDAHESDRLVRYDRLLQHARQVFGTTESARLWLGFPQYGLGGAVPLDYARTEVGAREVDDLLGRIEWGVLS